MLRAYGVTDKGRVRPINEDCWAFDETRNLCVVADGMGGHNAGEVAARIAVDTVVRFLASDSTAAAHWPFGYDPSLSFAGNRLRTAIHLAHVQVLQAAVTSNRYSGMGTTIVAAFVDGNRLSVAHVGDSRLYLLAGDHIRQLTHDDSWMASMLAEDPAADVAALEHHPMRNALTNVVGASRRTDVHVVEEVAERRGTAAAVDRRRPRRTGRRPDRAVDARLERPGADRGEPGGRRPRARQPRQLHGRRRALCA